MEENLASTQLGSSFSVGTTCIYKMKWKRTDVINIIKGASYIELYEVHYPASSDGNYTTWYTITTKLTAWLDLLYKLHRTV